jgi:predicted nucleic acid-binding protein
MTAAVALLDANVLYAAPLRDLLIQLAFTGLFQARWSAAIDDEWTRNLRAARPELTEYITRTQFLMHRSIPDALVTNYESQIAGLILPDPDDRHVLAAAITAAADVIVTFNTKDFPTAVLAPYGIVAQHPDAFLKSFIIAMPSHILAGVRECLGRLIRPPISPANYLDNIRKIGLIETAAFLEANRGQWHP